ncbi:sensor histidine kinase [Candidatus Electronema sp. TJ]|uniref:sensor histidine kinase n=1 Tax=Candidatus Electronema sp. TJ TaxID=3401573 RepID=UPI003AA98085
MRRLSLLNSLSRRIRLGYGLMVTLVALIMLLVGLGLADIRQRVSALEAVSALSDTVLEIRRYEKNWLLYRQEQDFFENRMQLEKALALLVEQERRQVAASLQRMQEELKSGLLLYRELINKDFSFFQVAQRHAEEEQIRSVGKRLVDLSGAMNESIRSSIDGKLASLTLTGLLFVLAVAGLALFLGRQMSTLVVRPLQGIVEYTRSIAQGRFPSQQNDEADLTEIRAVTEAIRSMLDVLEKREKQLVQSEKLAAVGTLVAGVAHELNNPLSNASSSAQILLEELQEANIPDSEFLLEMAAQIDEETDRARNIIRSLLEFAHDREMRPAELELERFIRQTSRLVVNDFPAEIEFTVDISKDGLFFADKRQLQQALINILRNAGQALEGSGKILLRAGIDEERGEALIEVRDNGPGIAAMDLEKIFDPFYTTKDVGKGSGLGLAVTREIISKHGGTITVESEEGRGAAFFIRLPVSLAAARQEKNVAR